jgi:hypothetical protein
VEKDVALDNWASMAIFGPVLAFAQLDSSNGCGFPVFKGALLFKHTGNPRDSPGIDTWRFVHSPITLCLFV